jgi:hypothetical protein
MGMEGECALDAVVLEQRLAASDFFEDFGWEILAVEEQAEMCLIHVRIVKECQEDVRGVMVEKVA